MNTARTVNASRRRMVQIFNDRPTRLLRRILMTGEGRVSAIRQDGYAVCEAWGRGREAPLRLFAKDDPAATRQPKHRLQFSVFGVPARTHKGIHCCGPSASCKGCARNDSSS